jgi:glutamate synthase (NADPH/NADH) small chain
MYGIPNMKLEKETVDRRVNLLREEGIEFVTNADIGKNVDVNELKADFDALCLTLGSTKPRDLPVPGRDLKGVHFAMVRLIIIILIGLGCSTVCTRFIFYFPCALSVL